MTREEQIEELGKLTDGETINLDWFEGGGYIAYKLNDVFVLFTVPQYGGTERYEKTFYTSDKDGMLDYIYRGIL